MITYITMFSNRFKAVQFAELLNIPNGGWKGIFTVKKTEGGCWIVEHVHASEHEKIGRAALRKVDAMKSWYNNFYTELSVKEGTRAVNQYVQVNGA